MKLSPRDFWSLTPGEWRWLMEAAAPSMATDAMSFEDFAALASAYPDAPQSSAP